MPERITPAEVPGLLRPGMEVFVAGTTAEPTSLIAALEAAPEASRGVRYCGIFVPGLNRFDLAALHPDARMLSFFVTPEMRRSNAAGRIDFVAMQYHDIYRFLAREARFDVALIQVAAPDRAGRFSLGVAVDFVPAVLDRADLIVAEVNRRMPVHPSAPTLSADQIGAIVEVNHALPELVPGPAGDAVVQVARQVAALVRNGDCIQVGIGTLPEAVLGELRDREDLGFHGGMVTDGVRDLVQRGVISGRRKAVDPGLAVAGVAMGSASLYPWVAARTDIALRPVDVTHDAAYIGGLDDFVAINSALEVDLFGQVNADVLAGRQVSGTGGSVDFMRGAARSRGGRAIVALTATAARGTASRIVTALKPEVPATALRTDVDLVVTEYGTARLKGRPLAERAEALIGIAAPDFRDALRDGWRAVARTWA